MKKKTFFLSAGVSLFTAYFFCGTGYTYAASQETQHVRPVEKWVVEPVSDDGDDKYDFCMARTYYNNGLIFIMARDKYNRQRIAINFPDNRLTLGDTYPVKLAIDKNPGTAFTATAAGKNMLIVSFDEGDNFLKKIGGGYAMTMSSSNDAVEFDLYGVGESLEKLSACAKDNLPKAVEPVPEPGGNIDIADAAPVKNIPPVVTPLSETVKTKSAVAPAKIYEPERIMLPPVISGALNKAAHPAENPAVPSSVSPKIPLDYVWSYPGIFAGYRNINAASGFGNTVKSYINSMRTLCDGPFIAEASPVYTINNIEFMHAEIGCSSSKRDSIASLLFYEQVKGSVYTLYFESSSDRGADVISLRNNVSKNIEASVRKR